MQRNKPGDLVTDSHRPITPARAGNVGTHEKPTAKIYLNTVMFILNLLLEEVP